MKGTVRPRCHGNHLDYTATSGPAVRCGTTLQTVTTVGYAVPTERGIRIDWLDLTAAVMNRVRRVVDSHTLIVDLQRLHSITSTFVEAAQRRIALVLKGPWSATFANRGAAPWRSRQEVTFAGGSQRSKPQSKVTRSRVLNDRRALPAGCEKGVN